MEIKRVKIVPKLKKVQKKFKETKKLIDKIIIT